MTESHLIQGSEAWKEWRRSRIGAADAGAILGVSPWTTPYQLWSEKIGIAEPKQLNLAMSRGHELEEPARHEFMRMTHIAVTPQVVEHPTMPWMVASLDGLSLDGKNALEIKCPGKVDHESALCGLVPNKYMPQLQHQLEVTGLDSIYYFSFDGEEGVIIEVKRNQKYIDDLLEKEKEFYRCMQELEAPPLTDKDYIQRTDNEWINLAIEYKLTKIQLKELERKEAELRERLCGMSGQQNSTGGGIRLQKIAKKGSIEYSRIKELKDIDLEAYRKPCSKYWKITEV